ncbi:hypothetical protein DZD52_06365 [Xanthomonas nasturtii]|uniref:Uncharacterized protein n=1 Tax=Xanthomonas nasturtii TaxID=1843581 RepID=A0A3E1KN80_9XANT|nr:hypothetical protein DZD52_06365 [Xanthomonas nasturtii]
MSLLNARGNAFGLAGGDNLARRPSSAHAGHLLPHEGGQCPGGRRSQAVLHSSAVASPSPVGRATVLINWRR